jgi:hypothetical protein
VNIADGEVSFFGHMNQQIKQAHACAPTIVRARIRQLGVAFARI